MLAVFFLTLGILSRLMIHVPNFTSVVALSLLGGVYLNKRQALILPLVLLAISDLVIGWHETVVFTWGSIVLISALGLWVRQHKSFKNVLAVSVVSSLLFFVITNFGVWLVSGMYPMTMAGLTECFVLALPFFRSELLGTLVYTCVLFGGYEFVYSRMKNTRWAHAL